MGTIIVTGILVLIIGGAVLKMIRDKKQGKTCCGGNCSHCRECHR